MYEPSLPALEEAIKSRLAKNNLYFEGPDGQFYQLVSASRYSYYITKNKAVLVIPKQNGDGALGFYYDFTPGRKRYELLFDMRLWTFSFSFGKDIKVSMSGDTFTVTANSFTGTNVVFEYGVEIPSVGSNAFVKDRSATICTKTGRTIRVDGTFDFECGQILNLIENKERLMGSC